MTNSQLAKDILWARRTLAELLARLQALIAKGVKL